LNFGWQNFAISSKVMKSDEPNRAGSAKMKLSTIVAMGFCLFAFVQVAAAAPQDGSCDLPLDLQHQIAMKYPGAKVVTLLDLAEDDRKFFQKDHSSSCPGLVKVDFYGGGQPTLAMVLIVDGGGATEKAQLVMAHEIKRKWVTALFETAKLSVPVVWSQGPGEYEDVYGNKTIQSKRPVIVFCGYSSWAVLYAWTGSRVTKIWLRD
jgi:hypothetical protein